MFSKIIFVVCILVCDSDAAKFTELQKRAEQGDVEAQFFLGHRYNFGLGVLENTSEAVKWYCKAAEQGHVEAQYMLARSYFFGLGVLKDELEGIKWYRKAAEQGHVNALLHLGWHYRFVIKDKQEAIKWYSKAVECGETTFAPDHIKELTRKHNIRGATRVLVRHRR